MSLSRRCLSMRNVLEVNRKGCRGRPECGAYPEFASQRPGPQAAFAGAGCRRPAVAGRHRVAGGGAENVRVPTVGRARTDQPMPTGARSASRPPRSATASRSRLLTPPVSRALVVALDGALHHDQTRPKRPTSSVRTRFARDRGDRDVPVSMIAISERHASHLPGTKLRAPCPEPTSPTLALC